MSKHKRIKGIHKGKPTPHKEEQPKRTRKSTALAISIVLGLGIAPAGAYTIKQGDTLSSIARQNGTTVKRLVRINGIKNPNLIYAGDRIRLRRHGKVKPHVTDTRETRVSRSTDVRPNLNTDCSAVPAAGYWNAHTSSSWDINVPGSGDLGNPVKAAASGTVRYVYYWGGSYGNHTLIGDRLYAHLSAVYVRPGQYVSRCQLIGRVGMSGNASGPHLHYEVR